MIEDIIDCGRLAATANNLQPWEFVAVTEPATLRAIAGVATFGSFIAQAAACVVVLCKDTKYYLEDGCNASQNILLAAQAHGLGGCWVAGDRKPYADRIRSMVGAPEGYKLISLLSIGHPAEKPVKDKRALADVLHWERF